MALSDDEYSAALTEFDWNNLDSNDFPHTTQNNHTSSSPSSSQMRRCADLEGRKAECHRVLRETFGHSGYRGKQKWIVEAAVSGQDVFVLAPTGMGKSLCFQIPAASDKSGVTVVISPLLALMNNQVASLRKKDVFTHALTSETPMSTRQEVFQDLMSENPEIRLLYTTPERLATGDFMRLLMVMYENGMLNRLVVDEAHCISEWGHDFRDDYRKLGAFRKKFPEIPIMALTATATPDVQKDIVTSLGMVEDNLYRAIHPFNRANLYYEIRYTGGTDQLALMSEICQYIFGLFQKRGKPSSGIIYCRRRNTCNELSAFLRGKGMSARPYHRGLPSSELDKTFREWTIEGGSLNGGVDVVVATVAFGLGIDKGDVRYIIHYDCPTSMEGYYQETGRAGRNGSPSKCILYYSREDVTIAKKLVAQGQTRRIVAAEEMKGPAPSQRALSSLEALVKMAENTRVCRHVSICRYFGETIDANDKELLKSLCNNMCDVCKYPEKTRRRKDKLSSEEYAASQAESWQFGNDDDERPLHKSNNANLLSKTGSFQSGKPALGSYFGTKRMMGAAVGSESAPKKPKVSYGLPASLVTRPFSSASTLAKPFRPPLMKTTSTSSNSSDPPPSPKRVMAPKATRTVKQSPSPTNGRQFENDDETLVKIEERDFAILQRASSPVDLPDVFFGLEEPTSEKIPSSSRREGVDRIRMALHKTLTKNPKLWSRFKRVPSNTERRDRIIALTAKEIEYELVLCFSSTLEGYRERIAVKVENVELMTREKAWNGCQEEEYEDAQLIIKIMERTCKIG